MTKVQNKIIPSGINVPKYDSMSLQIPYNQCKIINQELNSKYQKILLNTGEVLPEEHDPKPIKIQKNGITIRIGFNEITIFDNKNSQQKTPIRVRNIRVTLPAKLLKNNYFEGINKNNIKDLYNEFMKFEIFKCTYKTFIESLPTDIDICKDRYTNSTEEFTKSLRSIIKQTESNKHYTRLWTEHKNIGLRFNKRESATPTKPHIKIYSKQYDLETKSLEFAKKYLTKYNTINLIRVEATIKNSKHKRRLTKKGILPEFKTLEQLLNISDQDKNKFLNHSIENYIMKTIRVKTENLTPTEQILTEFMEQLILNQYDYNQIIGLSQYITMKNKESEARTIRRTKNKLKYLYDNIIHNNEQLNKISGENIGVQNILKWLGIKNH